MSGTGKAKTQKATRFPFEARGPHDPKGVTSPRPRRQAGAGVVPGSPHGTSSGRDSPRTTRTCHSISGHGCRPQTSCGSRSRAYPPRTDPREKARTRSGKDRGEGGGIQPVCRASIEEISTRWGSTPAIPDVSNLYHIAVDGKNDLVRPYECVPKRKRELLHILQNGTAQREVLKRIDSFVEIVMQAYCRRWRTIRQPRHDLLDIAYCLAGKDGGKLHCRGGKLNF